MQSKAVLVVLLILALVAVPAMAVSQKAAENGINGKGNAEHLYLFEKDPVNWTIVDGGAWGKLTYHLENNPKSNGKSAGKFVFTGHGLESGSEYALIYYPDPWPGVGLEVLGTGTANGGGNVNIKGDVDFAGLHIESDTNPGSKIWLVLAADIGESQMSGWNPTEYLFEYQLI